MERTLTLVVSLFIHRGKRDQFESFERQAGEIMQGYGGRIQQRIRFTASADLTQPDEMHFVTFPDQASFDEYQRDAQLISLSQLRAVAVRETHTWVVADVP